MTSMPCRRFVCLLAVLLSLGTFVPARAHHTAQHEPAVLGSVSFEQRLQEFIPLDVVFWDETGRQVPLRAYFGRQPVILSLVYYDCPNLCTLVNVLIVSINPDDTPALAAAKKAQYVRGYGRAGAVNGWHFLTGSSEAIQRLAQAVGFHYTYDTAREQFTHASGMMVLTPQGQLARYFYGVEYAPRDVRLSLVEAAADKIGSPIDQLLLLCYHYDPQSGTYSLAILRALRVAGVATVVALGTGVGVMLHRERRKRARKAEGG